MSAISARLSKCVAGLVLCAVSVQSGAVAAQYMEPVEGPVIDGFRPPEHFGGPGNRGWEYATVPGSSVRAAADGVVTFAGPIGSAMYISIGHANGLRTTYSQVGSVLVRRGDSVTAGAIIATARGTLHFGALDHGTYIDPATLFGGGESGAPMLVRWGERANVDSVASPSVWVSGRPQ